MQKHSQNCHQPLKNWINVRICYFHTFSLIYLHFGQIQYFFKVLETCFTIQYFFNTFNTAWEPWLWQSNFPECEHKFITFVGGVPRAKDVIAREVVVQKNFIPSSSGPRLLTCRITYRRSAALKTGQGCCAPIWAWLFRH